MGSGGPGCSRVPSAGLWVSRHAHGLEGSETRFEKSQNWSKVEHRTLGRLPRAPGYSAFCMLTAPPYSSGGSKHFTSIIRDPPRAFGTALSPARHGDARDVPSLCHPHVHPQPFASRSGAAIPTTLPSPGAENRSRSPDSHFPLSFQARSTARSGQPCTPCALPAGQHQPWLHKGEGSSCPRTFPSLKIFFNYREAAQ